MITGEQVYTQAHFGTATSFAIPILIWVHTGPKSQGKQGQQEGQSAVCSSRDFTSFLLASRFLRLLHFVLKFQLWGQEQPFVVAHPHNIALRQHLLQQDPNQPFVGYSRKVGDIQALEVPARGTRRGGVLEKKTLFKNMHPASLSFPK